MKVLCCFGQHQYGDPSRGEGIEYAAFIPALTRLGHEVRHFDSWNRTLYSDFAELNLRLVAEVEAFRPDVLLSVVMEYELWNETLDAIRARGDVAMVSWAADDSWKFREVSRFIGRHYHAMTTTYDYRLADYHALGITKVLLTQWAVASTHLAEPLPATACRWPVSFVGAAHGDRRARIERLRAAGIEVACFGHGWENAPVCTAEMFRIIRESVISLNFANSRGASQIKARCFEVPGAGGFLLTEAASSIERFYLPEQEIAVFRSDDELVSAIVHYQEHPTERDRIAVAGYQRTVREHTYEQRLDALLHFTLAAQRAEQQSTSSVSPQRSFAVIDEAVLRYRSNVPLRLLRALLVGAACLLLGRQRGLRAARRLVFELSWRLAGQATYSARGWPGRMFPQT